MEKVTLEKKDGYMDKRSEADNQLVINYRLHRKLLGLLGIFLPIGLLIGSMIWMEVNRNSN